MKHGLNRTIKKIHLTGFMRRRRGENFSRRRERDYFVSCGANRNRLYSCEQVDLLFTSTNVRRSLSLGDEH
jgi:hypothetical protein